MTEPELNRRRWLLRLGETVVLSGFSGLVLDAKDASTLPAGLYLPDINHLAHARASVPAASSLSATPLYFDSEDFRLLTKLVALILGEEPGAAPVPEIALWLDRIVGESAAVRNAARALTPSARRLAIDYYGAETVKDLEESEPQPLCRSGFESLRAHSFLTMSESDQLAQLTALENAGNPFLRWLKERVIEGFYTSKEGLKELDYKGNSFYAESPGCTA